MLTRWNPFNELWGFDEPWGGARFQPAVDVREDENMVNLKVELPGVKPEDIKVEVHGNTLTISGERSMEKEDEAGVLTRSGVDAEGVKGSRPEKGVELRLFQISRESLT